MTLIRYEQRYHFLKMATDVFLSLQLDPAGRKKFELYLEGAKNKLAQIEYSLGQLAGKEIIDEESFAPPLSDARRMTEECYAGGWNAFNHQGSGCFGSVVNLEVTLCSMTHSLRGYMIWNIPQKAETI